MQSVALDVLRIAVMLRFAAMVGKRARSMRAEDLEFQKHALGAALSSTDQELKDLW